MLKIELGLAKKLPLTYKFIHPHPTPRKIYYYNESQLYWLEYFGNCLARGMSVLHTGAALKNKGACIRILDGCYIVEWGLHRAAGDV